MKQLIVSILAFSLYSTGAIAQCFTPSWTESSFKSMFIYVSVASLYGNNLQVGDEVGVFDGEVCVGAGVLTEELTGAPVYLVIEASRFFSQIPGFKPGNTITYRFCSGGEIVSHPVVPTYLNNGPTFASSDSCIVELHAINKPPTFLSVPDTMATQDLPYSLPVRASDADGDSVIYSAPVLPRWLRFDDSTHVLNGTPGNRDVGKHKVVLRIHDGITEVIQEFALSVKNVNDPPTVLSVPVTEARPGIAYSYTVRAEDVDGDSLTYTAVVLPGWLSFDPATHTLSATPGEDDAGDQHVTIRISDGSLHVDHTFVISVSDANHAPTFTSEPSTSVVVGNSYRYAVTAQDIDGDTLSFSTPVLPSWMAFNPDSLLISGVPGSDDIGTHEITVRVSDGTVSADQSFHLTVRNVNSIPVFTSDPITSVTEGELYIYHALAEDADGDSLTYTALVLPGWLTFDEGTQILFGIPAHEDVGDHPVTMVVSDGEAATNQEFIITVELKATGITDVSSPDFLRIYPNPTDGTLRVELAQEADTEIFLEILDPLGRVVQQSVFPPSVPIHEEYSLYHLSPGIYFIRIHNESFRSVRKLLLRR